MGWDWVAGGSSGREAWRWLQTTKFAAKGKEKEKPIDECSAHRRHGFHWGLIAAYLFLRPPIFKWISDGELIKEAHGADLLGFGGRRGGVDVVVKLLVFVTGSK
jgi:hypothetical protein